MTPGAKIEPPGKMGVKMRRKRVFGQGPCGPLRALPFLPGGLEATQRAWGGGGRRRRRRRAAVAPHSALGRPDPHLTQPPAATAVN